MTNNYNLQYVKLNRTISGLPENAIVAVFRPRQKKKLKEDGVDKKYAAVAACGTRIFVASRDCDDIKFVDVPELVALCIIRKVRSYRRLQKLNGRSSESKFLPGDKRIKSKRKGGGSAHHVSRNGIAHFKSRSSVRLYG